MNAPTPHLSHRLVTAREQAPLPLKTALLGLERQSALDLPVKLTVGATGEPALVAELPAALYASASARRAALLPLLDAGLAWICDGRASSGDAERIGDDRLAVIEAIEALGMSAVEVGDGRFTVEERLGLTRGGRVFVDACGNGFVRIAQPVGLATIDNTILDGTPSAAKQRALRAFALEVNPRLSLGRTAVEAVGADAPESFRLRWEAIIPISRRLDRDFVAALAATASAREATQPAYRALTFAEAAEAYLETFERRCPSRPETGALADTDDGAPPPATATA